MFTEDVIQEITAAAKGVGLEPAALLAVAEIESGGQVFALVEGRQEPLIRFEGHYFDRRLSEEKRAIAREKGLASPMAGAVANPKTQAARWRLLEQAAAIDAKAAYESVSWGLGQVMGAHWAWLGYADVDALVAEARSGAAGQARLMTRYIDKAALAQALAKHDWPVFAHGYNGPNYKQNAYDSRMAAAYAHYASGGGATPTILWQGLKGEAVAELQRNLTALGYPLTADGDFGSGTVQAVKKFQAEHSLASDGIVGPATQSAVRKALRPQNVSLGLWARIKAWLAGIFGAG